MILIDSDIPIYLVGALYPHKEDAGFSTRDALHVAIMRRHEIGRVMSFDTGFDQVEGIDRIR